MNWVCEDAWKGPFSQSVFYLGGVVGTLFFGVLADRVGRFPAFFSSSALIFIAGMATPFCTDFYSFTVIRFIMGLTYDSAFSTFYLLGNSAYFTWWGSLGVKHEFHENPDSEVMGVAASSWRAGQKMDKM